MVVTKSGKTFPENEDDWQFFCESVPQALAEIAGKDFKVVIFTNQRGIQVSDSSSILFCMNKAEYIRLKFSNLIETILLWTTTQQRENYVINDALSM